MPGAIMTLTPSAMDRLRTLYQGRGEGDFLKLGLKKGGCAGMEYTLDWVAQRAPLDEVVSQEDVRLLIDSKAVLFLLGCEMDFKSEKFKTGFVFHNPNQTSACGCGESVELVPALKAGD